MSKGIIQGNLQAFKEILCLAKSLEDKISYGTGDILDVKDIKKRCEDSIAYINKNLKGDKNE